MSERPIHATPLSGISVGTQSKAEAVRRWYLRALWLLIPGLLAINAISLWWLDRWSLNVAFDAYLAWQRVLANVAVGLTIMLLLSALTRRLLASILTVAVCHALLYVASSIKLKTIGLPVILQDIHFIGGLDVSSFHLLWKYVRAPQEWLAGAVAFIGGMAALFWLEPAWCRTRSVVRILVLACTTGLLITLYMAAWPWNTRWYDKAHIRPSPLSSTPATLHGGLVASMVYYHGVHRQRELNVDTAALQRTIAMVAGEGHAAGFTAADRDLRPDVVIVLSESFMDPRILKDFESVPDLIPAVRREIQAGNGGTMRAPAYGGGTVRTEFEVLTGMPVAAFPDVSYPYVDLNPGFVPGVVSALENHGYASLALHGNSGAFWNRANTYRAMGIDRFIAQRGLLKAGGYLDGGWLSDRSMTDILLTELGKATKPTVAIAISIESHGPYDSKHEVLAPDARASIRLPSGLDAAAEAELRNYLYHLSNADREFDRLLTGLRSRERPFVLLFFGDHLPAFMGGSYEQPGFVDGRGPEEQSVPWVLLADGGGAARGRMPATAHAWQLPALLMGAAGIDDDGWFDFVAKVGKKLDAEGGGADAARLSEGLNAGAMARLQDRFDEHARARR